MTDCEHTTHELLNLLGVVLVNTQLVVWAAPDHPARHELAEIKDAATTAVELVRRAAGAVPE